MTEIHVTPPLEELLEHAGWLRRLAARLVAGPHDAEDLVQEVWRATLATERRDVRSPRAWLAGALRNVIKLRARGEARRSQREQARAARTEVPSAATLVGEQELRHQLLEHVDALPDSERDVVLLRFYRDLPPREVASELGLPVNTVRSRTARALQRLRERLDDQHGDRRTWCLAIVPLLDARGLQAVGVGEVARRSRALLVGAAVVTIAAGGYLGYESWTAREIVDLARTTPADEALQRFEAAAQVDVEPAVERRAAVPAQVPFAGKVVDLEGRAIEGAMVHLAERWWFDRMVEDRKVRAEDWSRHTDERGAFAFVGSQVDRVQGDIRLGAPVHRDYEAELGWSDWERADAPILRMRRAFDATVEVEAVERGSGEPIRFAASCWSSWGEWSKPNVVSNHDPKMRSLSWRGDDRVGGVLRLQVRIVAGAQNRLSIEVPGGEGRTIDLEVPGEHGRVYRFREEFTFDRAANDPASAVTRGRVVDAETGEPVHGACVRRVREVVDGRSTTRSSQATQTRRDGRYALGYEAASEADVVQIDHPDYLMTEQSWTGADVLDVELHRKPSLVVRVLDDGRPLANVPLLLKFDRESQRAQTGEDGRVDFGVLATREPWVFVLPSKRAADDHALARRVVRLVAGKREELVIEMRVPDRVSVFGNVVQVPGSEAVIAPTFVPLADGRGWVASRRLGVAGYEAGDMRRGSYLVFLAPTDDRFHEGPFAFGGVLDLDRAVSQVHDVVMPTGRVHGRLLGADSWDGLHVVAVPELPRRSQAVNQFLGSEKLGAMLGAEVASDGFFSVERVADGAFTLEVRRGAKVIASRRIEVLAGTATVGDWKLED